MPIEAKGKHQHQHHGKKQRTRTRTFGNGNAIAIPDVGAGNPYPSTIAVGGFKKGHIQDVNVTLRGLSHTFTRDVDVLLVAPDGRNLVVMGDIGDTGGSGSVVDVTLTIDDEAALPLPVDESLTSGAFRPLDQFGPTDTDGPTLLDFPDPAPVVSGAAALSVFDGINPNGQWQLFVLDDTVGDEGAFSGGWSLTITAREKKK
jgi:subtilisin-like proprotein convertase family protein